MSLGLLGEPPDDHIHGGIEQAFRHQSLDHEPRRLSHHGRGARHDSGPRGVT